MPSPTLNPRGEAAFSGACLAVNSPQALRLLLHIADNVALSVSGLKFANKRTWLTAAKLESPPRLQRGFDWTASLIQIDHCGDRLTGCPACNVWRGDKSAFIVELAVEDWEALGKLRESVKWTLRPRKN